MGGIDGVHRGLGPTGPLAGLKCTHMPSLG